MIATTPLSPKAVLGRGLVLGLLWSVGICASEALVLPFGQLDSGEQFVAMWPIFSHWSWTGVAIAYATIVLEPRLDRAWKIALFTTIVSVLGAAGTAGIWVVYGALGIGQHALRQLGDTPPSWSLFFYCTWMTLFHGGLFIVACVLVTRAQRNRALLGAAQIARDQTEALLDEARLDALRGQIDPAVLLAAMGAVQARYASDPAGADRLLDLLVAFLRGAMPIVRGGGSTLKAEVALARAYAELGAATDSGSTLWRIHAPGPLPDMRFPPLLLLPLMDHVNSHRDTLPRVPREARLVIASDAAGIEIGIDTGGGARAAECALALPYRLQVALRAAFGDAWSVGPAAGPPGRGAVVALRITHPAAPAAGPAPKADSVVPTLAGNPVHP